MSTVETKPAKRTANIRLGDPCSMVIFGAAGDLTRRKLFPALYHLAENKLLSDNFCIIGTGRRPYSHEDYRAKVVEDLKEFATANPNPDLIKWFTDRIYFLQGDFKDPSSYKALSSLLDQVDTAHNTKGNHLYYLATPPDWFGPIADQLGQAGLTAQGKDHWRRLVVEKPFGDNLQSAIALNKQLLTSVQENQIFRIDHYLGKETVQNIMVFRFADGLFEPIWNHNYIDNVQITVAETVGVEGRGGYYDGVGALRDMLQNHMFQVLALTAMEPPARYEAEIVRDAKRDVFRAIRRMKPEDVQRNVVRAQYTEGTIGSKSIPDYRAEPSINPDSMTETYVALKLFIDNARWKNVPFYLRTGKSLAKRTSEIAIRFRRQTLTQFDEMAVENLSPSTLILRLQPDDGINLRIGAKVPGTVMKMDMVEMNFCYKDYFGAQGAGGYETLLYDIMNGDHTLFTRADNLETNWSIVDPILNYWASAPKDTLYTYSAGSWGPKQSSDMLSKDHRRWRRIPDNS